MSALGQEVDIQLRAQACPLYLRVPTFVGVLQLVERQVVILSTEKQRISMLGRIERTAHGIFRADALVEPHAPSGHKDGLITVEELDPVFLVRCLRATCPKAPELLALAELIGISPQKKEFGLLRPLKAAMAAL